MLKKIKISIICIFIFSIGSNSFALTNGWTGWGQITAIYPSVDVIVFFSTANDAIGTCKGAGSGSNATTRYAIYITDLNKVKIAALLQCYQNQSYLKLHFTTATAVCDPEPDRFLINGTPNEP